MTSLSKTSQYPATTPAFAAKTGEQYYFNARLPQSWTIKASPLGANGRIYLSSQEGDVVVLRRGPQLEVLAVNSVDEQILATPALVGTDLFLRTREHLYRISEETNAALDRSVVQ